MFHDIVLSQAIHIITVMPINSHDLRMKFASGSEGVMETLFFLLREVGFLREEGARNVVPAASRKRTASACITLTLTHELKWEY